MKFSTASIAAWSTLKHLLPHLERFIVCDAEPHIWKTWDHETCCWHAYDPTTGQGVEVSSEADMRAWLEERYYAH